MPENRNGWEEHKRLVLYRFDELEKKIEKVDTKVDTLTKKVDFTSTRVAALHVKSGFWGAFGGFMAVLLSLILMALKTGV